MTAPATFAVLLAPAAFVLVALVALARPGRRPVAVQRAGTAAALVGVVVAAGAGLATARSGLIESPTLGVGGLGASVRLDALSTVMLGMLALVIVRFSNTYLDGDPRHGVFLGRLAATIAAVEVLHNVVGRLGVLEGNAGDLRVGLPHQSVHDGERPQHEPVRLQVVVEAPVAAMTQVLATHDQVRQLCDHGWLSLLALGEDGTVTHRYVGGLHWEETSE